MKNKLLNFLRKIKYDYSYGLFDVLRRKESGLLTPYQPESLRSVKPQDCCLHDSLILISAVYPIKCDTEIDLMPIGDGQAVAPIMADALRDLLVASERDCGEEVIFTSAYRTLAFQASIYGVNPYAVKPGESEHHSGLGLDIKVDGYAQRRFIMSRTGKWMAKHAHEYGFVIRYPLWGEKKTGMPYEPWHLRYVGNPHAEIIYRRKLVLESYLALLEKERFLRFGDIVISAQQGEELLIPKDVETVTLAHNTRGGYIVWFKI